MFLFRYHIVVDGKTCVFEKENDPRVLRYVTKCIFIFIYRIAEKFGEFTHFEHSVEKSLANE